MVELSFSFADKISDWTKCEEAKYEAEKLQRELEKQKVPTISRISYSWSFTAYQNHEIQLFYCCFNYSFLSPKYIDEVFLTNFHQALDEAAKAAQMASTEQSSKGVKGKKGGKDDAKGKKGKGSASSRMN